jgi:hypothetical protein
MPAATTTAPPEYRLLVSRQLNERLQIPTLRIILETEQSFASFRYELSVEEQRDLNRLRFRILGLRAPQISLSGAGHASFMKEYDDLTGRCVITVVGLDGTETTCAVHVDAHGIRLASRPSTPHVTLLLNHTHKKERTKR